MEIYNDFKQKLIDLTGKRVRICFHLPEMGQTRGYDYLGRILEIDEKTNCLSLQIDPQDDEVIQVTHLNLEAVVIYGVDEIDEEADLSDKSEAKFPRGTLIQSTPINEANQLIEEGWVIHDTFAKTVTLLKYPEAEDQTKESANVE